MTNSINSVCSLALALSLAACGGGDKSSSEKPQASNEPTTSSGAAWSNAALTPKSGGKVIVVEAMTDETGANRFSPNEVTASDGDVIRFTLKLGAHNVHFLPDSNKVQGGFPSDASDVLQLPGQTVEVLVTAPAGKYYFQCDPHAALGMMGHVTVK